MLRKNKNIVTYQGGRAIGGAAARAFTREATTKLLAGRTIAKPDAPEEQAIKKHTDAVVRKARSVDIRSDANSLRGGQWRDTW
jgi:hypothetical protein